LIKEYSKLPKLVIMEDQINVSDHPI